MSDSPIFVLGHKNPDTDAICSAIAYAAFQQAKGNDRYVAARCGNSNSRIDAVLKRFNQPLPRFVGDVTPRVHDLMRKEVHHVTREATCAEALRLMESSGVRTLPVLEDADSRKLVGIVSIIHLGEFFIPKPENNVEIRHVHTSLQSIADSLQADVVKLVNADALEHLYVRVGAMDIRSFGRFVNQKETPPEQSIIIVGDRWDIQQKAIQMGVRLLIITGGQELDSEVLQMAEERNVSVIVSPWDSASTAWVTRTATRLEPMVDTNVVSFHEDDTLAMVRRRIARNQAPSYVVTDEEGRLEGLFTNTDIIRPVERGIVLVDHNELSQAVNGADTVDILEIIDHHRLGNPPSQQPVYFHNEPVGSTCTIVADMFRRDNLMPSADIAGIMMSGIISDTLLLKSPTSTEKDKQILEWLAVIAGIQPSELADLIFSSGSLILTTTPDKVVGTDCKIYEEDELRFSVAQIEELGFENFWKHTEPIDEALEQYREENHLFFSALLVTDIRSQNSLMLIRGNPEIIRSISYPNVEQDRIFDLPGIVSRKKQLIPYLSTLLEGSPAT